MGGKDFLLASMTLGSTGWKTAFVQDEPDSAIKDMDWRFPDILLLITRVFDENASKLFPSFDQETHETRSLVFMSCQPSSMPRTDMSHRTMRPSDVPAARIVPNGLKEQQVINAVGE